MSEVRMPHPRDPSIGVIQINNWLGKSRHWSLLCSVLGTMRTGPSAVTTRVKEVREFPIGVVGHGLRAEDAESAR